MQDIFLVLGDYRVQLDNVCLPPPPTYPLYTLHQRDPHSLVPVQGAHTGRGGRIGIHQGQDCLSPHTGPLVIKKQTKTLDYHVTIIREIYCIKH